MKESVRVIRFAIVGTLNALIAAVVVWLLFTTSCGAKSGFSRLKQMTKKLASGIRCYFLLVLSHWPTVHNSFSC